MPRSDSVQAPTLRVEGCGGTEAACSFEANAGMQPVEAMPVIRFGVGAHSQEAFMTRTLIAASVLSILIGLGPALAQATPPVSPTPSEPGDMTKKKKSVKQAKPTKTKKSTKTQ